MINVSYLEDKVDITIYKDTVCNSSCFCFGITISSIKFRRNSYGRKN